jgi:hypothetical protein
MSGAGGLLQACEDRADARLRDLCHIGWRRQIEVLTGIRLALTDAGALMR